MWVDPHFPLISIANKLHSDWQHVYYKRYIPPYVPPVDPNAAYDTQNFDETFLDMEPVLDEYEGDEAETDQEPQTDTDRTDGDESNTTPSQSRSSSIRPAGRSGSRDEDETDVFDGYSFKGRHSIILDDGEEEDGSEGDEEDESGEDETTSSVNTGDQRSETTTLDEVETEGGEDDGHDEALEPKTPEARPVALPAEVKEAKAAAPVAEAKPDVQEPAKEPVQEVKEVKTPPPPPMQKPTKSEAELLEDEDLAQSAALAALVLDSQFDSHVKDHGKKPEVKPRPGKVARGRREKSGIPALDKDLSDVPDDDRLTETERDEEDDDWDFIEAGDGEEKMGVPRQSLWARGVVDRYKLSVFRKGSTPTAGRSVSGMSRASELTDVGQSPSPSHKRGRTSGINFRKNPRQFLRPKSPPSTFSNSTGQSFSATANSLSGSGAPATNGFLTPAMSPSLKSKESAVSMGGQSVSSDNSGNAASPTIPSALSGFETPVKGGHSKDLDKSTKKKTLRKYKHNAEKVFSIFSSPKPPQPSQS